MRTDPCHPSPCGVNAVCKERNGAGACQCIPEYFGDPYVECKPECTFNNDCPRDKACTNHKCVDPCPGVCGHNAQCSVVNHHPSCSCYVDHTGDPFRACHPIPPSTPKPERITDPCHPSPCGNYAECRNHNGVAICSCQQGYIGSPPNCRPECVVNSDCILTRACVQQKCTDPCSPSPCAFNAHCKVINHSPICSVSITHD